MPNNALRLDDEAAVLRHLYEDKQWSLAEIGEAVGLSGDTIGKRCREYGIKLRPSRSVRRSVLEKLRAALETVE